MQTMSTPGFNDATIGIVCALPKELAAVRATLECAVDPTCEIDSAGRKYALAQVAAKGGGRHIVAIALLPEMGNNSAAIRATNLLNNCPNLEYLLMVGIAGAVPNPKRAESHVRLGDIVVSDRSGVVQYDFVKESAAGSIEHRNAPRAPSGKLLEIVNWLRADEELGNRPWESLIEQAIERLGSAWQRPGETEDVLDDSVEGDSPVPHPNDPERRPGQPKVFHGPIAAANVLLKNPEKRNYLRERFFAKAVEMEGSGIADAAHQGSVDYLVIRGTCDYCNRNKNDVWQKYAAVIAASYARIFISSIPCPTPPARRSGTALTPAEPSASALVQSDLSFVYEKGYEHGRLANQLVQFQEGVSAQGTAPSRLIDGLKQSLPDLTADRSLSKPVGADEVASRVRAIRTHLETYDHSLAADIAQGLERLIAEGAEQIPQRRPEGSIRATRRPRNHRVQASSTRNGSWIKHIQGKGVLGWRPRGQ